MLLMTGDVLDKANEGLVVVTDAGGDDTGR